MQQHGFARNVEWSVGSTSADLQPDERDPSIELVLTPSEYSDAMFPYKFKVVYTVTIHGEELQTIYRWVAHLTQFVLSSCMHDFLPHAVFPVLFCFF
jgi:galactose mutarotase-like enzyme